MEGCGDEDDSAAGASGGGVAGVGVSGCGGYEVGKGCVEGVVGSKDVDAVGCKQRYSRGFDVMLYRMNRYPVRENVLDHRFESIGTQS